MKILLHFIFLINCYSDCLDDSWSTKNYWIGQTSSGISHGDNEYNYNDHIARPCYVDDVACIRHFFAHNSMCFPVHGPAPDPYILKNLVLDMPHCNITLNLIDAHVKGLNSGKIQEFYINRKTNTLVLEVEFEKLIIDTPVTVATYHLKGREPVELSDDSIIEFKHISFTLIIRNFGDANHVRSRVYTYFSENKPYLKVGIGITGTKDPKLIRMNRKWMDEIALSAEEAFVVQGPLYMAAYLNSMICDFKHI